MKYVDDNILSIEDGQVVTDPVVVEITKEDMVQFWKDMMNDKPKQLPIGEYKVVLCDRCNFEGIVHLRQHFCPKCYTMTSVVDEDANYNFDNLFQAWQDQKNVLADIINGDLLEWVGNFNEGIKMDPVEFTSCMGEEQEVD